MGPLISSLLWLFVSNMIAILITYLYFNKIVLYFQNLVTAILGMSVEKLSKIKNN